MSAPASTATLSLTTADQTVELTLQKSSPSGADAVAAFTVKDGTFTSVVVAIDGKLNDSDGWIKGLTVVNVAGGVVSGNITLTDNICHGFEVSSCGIYSSLRLRYVSGSGTIVVNAVGVPAGQVPVRNQLIVAQANSSTPQAITSSGAAAFSVGANGATNPALNIDASTASSATGIQIKSAAAGSGVAITVLSSGGGEGLTLTAKAGSGAQAGGTLTFTGGAGGGTSGAGGAVAFVGGAGTASNSAGGAVTNTGGAGFGSSAGGASTLVGGAGGATGAGGAITITSGAGGSSSGAAGAINISVGSATSGNGAAITITAGAGAGGTNSGGNLNLVGGAAVSTGTPGEVQVNADSNLITCMVAITATDASRAVFIAPRACRLKKVTYMHTTGSTSGTLQIEKLTGTTAAGSGTTLLTGTIDLSATTVANTSTAGTLIATVASLTFAAGDRASIKIAGTMTSLAGAIAVLSFAPC